MGAKKRILFVDDEPSVLGLLQVVSRRLGADWDAAFAESGEKALELVKAEPFDVVVSDMRMPGMDGVELLTQVMQLNPRSARVILSGYADQELVLRSVGTTHQYLTKPCDLQLLRSTIQRLLSLDRVLASEKFRIISARIQNLPSLPSLYFKLMEEVSSPEATVDSVGDLIARDVSLTAKLLQLVNSAFFGVARQVSSAPEAVQILGFGMVRTLALSIFVFSRFDPGKMPGFPMERLWKHSMATGLMARKIATSEKSDPVQVETAFTAGILHDIGKLVLGFSLPQLYQMAVEKAGRDHLPQWQAETEVIGANHAEVGAYLLGLWGLPASLVEAVAWHHQPRLRDPEELSPVSAVHLADYVQSRESPAQDPPLVPALDEQHLRQVGLYDRLDSW